MGILMCVIETLLTYATTLAFYLYLRASEYFSQRPELLRSHPIFARLLQLKQALTTLEELDFDLSDSDSGIGDSEEDDDSLDQAETEDVSLKRTRKGSRLGLDDLAELLREAEEAVTSVKTITKSKPAVLLQPKKEPPRKKRKTSATGKSAPVFDLEEPIYVPSKLRTAITAPISGDDDALGDAVVLDTADAADKKARKHTLRFHTSKIESASARRQVARLALRGDDDVPYRERRKEKEARVQREALAGRRGQGGDDLDDIEPESIRGATSGAGVNKDNESGEEDGNGYYSLVQRQKRERKESKKLAYEAGKAASRYAVRL
jgi:U3 small nucleolar RNA-associated protein 3